MHLHKRVNLNEELNQLGLSNDGTVLSEEEKSQRKQLRESIMDDIRKTIDKKVADVKNILASMTLKKPEAEKALQIVKERFASINVCDFIADASCPIKRKTEGLGEADKGKGELKPYIVSVAEVYHRDIPVDAKSEKEAREKANKEYEDGTNDAIPEFAYAMDMNGWPVTLSKVSAGKDAKKLKEDDNGYVCDVCGKPADFNFQKMWVKWVIKKGEIQVGIGNPEILPEFQEPTGEDNVFLCNEHAREEGYIK